MEKNSEQLGELFSALSTAQGQMNGALKDAKNPYFKSQYTTLDSCWDSCRAPLSCNGLSVVQAVEEEGGKMFLKTILGHKSGQYISSFVPLLLAKTDPQSLGSCLTYMRRYALCAIIGISPTDDDGEKAMETHRKKEDSKEDPDWEGLCKSLESTGCKREKDELVEFMNTLVKTNGPSLNTIVWQATQPSNIPRFIKTFDEWKGARAS